MKTRPPQTRAPLTGLIPLQFKDSQLLSRFSEDFLAPHEALWIFRCKTLAAASLKIPKAMRQLVQLPDQLIPPIIQALREGEYDVVYRRYHYLGWQVSHAEASYETAAALVGFQMVGLLSLIDEILAGSAKAVEVPKRAWRSALATFAKFHHNCRISFSKGYLEASRLHTGADKDLVQGTLDKLRLRQNQEAFLRGILRNTVRSFHFEDFFPMFARTLRESGKYDRVSVALITERPDSPEIFALSADGKSAVCEGFVVKDDCSIPAAIQTRKPVLKPEIRGDASCPTCAHLWREGIRSFVVVPLILGDRVIGTLNVSSGLPYHFKDSDLAFLQQLADELAPKVLSAWERSRLMEDLRLQSCANQILSRIRSTLDMARLDEIVCRELAQCFGADRVSLCEVFEDRGFCKIDQEFLNPSAAGEVRSVRGVYGIEEFREVIQILKKGEIIAASVEGAIHPVLREGKAVLERQQIKTLCWAPLFVHGRYWGAVTVNHCRRTYRWKKSEIEMLRGLTEQISKAMELALAYQRERETVDRLERIVRAGPSKGGRA